MLTPTRELAPDGQPWNVITLRNNAGMTVTVMDWGATLLSAQVPLADGSLREALLAAPRRSNIASRRHFWVRPSAATLTVSPIAASRSMAKS